MELTDPKVSAPLKQRSPAPLRRLRRWIVAGGLIVAVVLGGRAVGAGRLVGGALGAPSPTPTVHTAVVTRDTLVSTVSATGTLAFATTMNVTPKLSGTLRTFTLQVGDTVKPGASVAGLDSTDLDAQIAQAQINLKTAQSKQVEAEAPASVPTLDSARVAVLSAQQKLQSIEHAYSDSDIAAQKAAVGQAEAQREAAQHPYSATDLAAQKAAVDLAATQLSAAEHPYTAAEVAAQAETVRQDQVAIVEGNDNLVSVEKSYDVSRAVRDAQDRQNWYEVAYGATLHAFQQGQANQQKVDEDYSNLLSAKEALSTAQAKSESELLAARNQVAAANATLTAGQQKVALMQGGPTVADLASAQTSLTLAKLKLAQMEAGPTAATMASADAGLQAAQSKLAQMEQGPLQTDVQAATLAVQAAQDQLDLLNAGPDPATVGLAKLSTDAAQASLDSLTKQEAELTVTSPIGGTVLALGTSSTDSSQTIGVGASVTPATVLAVIADPQELQVNATVSEVDVARLKIGNNATLQVPALPSQTFHGTVSRISPQATNNQGVVTYGITVGVTDASVSLRPGMSANLTIVVGQATNALQVPIAAVQTAQGKTVVTVLGPTGQPQTVPVTTGVLGAQTIQVTGNLQPGDRVVIDLSQASTGGSGPPPGGASVLGGGK